MASGHRFGPRRAPRPVHFATILPRTGIHGNIRTDRPRNATLKITGFDAKGGSQLEFEKGGLHVMTFFRHHRQRGPVQALQMRLQG